jgi:RNA polymerase-binding transcription factor DksA
MATKPKNKTVNKKAEKKSKPLAKSSSTQKSSKPVKKSAPSKPATKPALSKIKSKISTTKTKGVATKLPAKENTPKGTVKSSKPSVQTIAPVKPMIKSESKVIEQNHAKHDPKSVHVMPTVAPKIITENKKQVNKTTNKTTSPPPTTNGKTRYSDSELAEFKKVLDDKLLIARQELNYLQEQIVEMNENNADIQGSDWFDDSSIHAEVELLNNMAIRQRQFIQNLDNAVVRIENKTYGICSITGTLIDKKRLLLVPHATKSIEAKHIEQATMVPEVNQVAPDERVLRRSAEGKAPKKAVTKKSKSKSSKEYDDDEGDDMIEAPIEDLDVAFEGGDD